MDGRKSTSNTTSGGPITYASGTWEQVDWEPFDVVSVDAYRDALLVHLRRLRAPAPPRRSQARPRPGLFGTLAGRYASALTAQP